MHKHTQSFLVTDCDGTFLEESLLLFLIKKLIENRVGNFRSNFEELLENKRIAYKKGMCSYDDFINYVVKNFLENINGLETAVVRACANQAVKECKYYVRRAVRHLINHYRDEGYFLILLSHSPEVIVEIFAKEWGFDAWVGTNYLTSKKGIYTGKAFSPCKDTALQKLVNQYYLTYDKSVAIGDTCADIPMLRLVEHPICVNPPYEMVEVAQKNGWEIIINYRNVNLVFPDGKALGANFINQKTVR